MAEGPGKSVDKIPSFERQNTDEVEDLPLKIPVSRSWRFLQKKHTSFSLLNRSAPSTITFSVQYACAESVGAV
jgi:hypothetical protein